MSDEELVAWLQLLQAHGIGPDTARRLLASFGLPQQIVAQSRHALERSSAAARPRRCCIPRLR